MNNLDDIPLLMECLKLNVSASRECFGFLRVGWVMGFVSVQEMEDTDLIKAGHEQATTLWKAWRMHG